MNDYSEQYKSPQWQKKRLKILSRDKFTCRYCGEKEKQLQVHHQYYLHNKKIWEYPNECLITLCENCHIEANEYQTWTKNSFIIGLINLGFTYLDIHNWCITLTEYKDKKSIVKLFKQIPKIQVKKYNHE